MATVSDFISSLKNKKQTVQRSAFGEYLSIVRQLASNDECDVEAVEAVLVAAGKDEDDLSRDVAIQQQRFQKAEMLRQHTQAKSDRVVAERELALAQEKLNEMYRKLQPAVDAAVLRRAANEQVIMTTMDASEWLSEHVLNTELLERERELNEQLRAVNAELKPLLLDRDHKRSSLVNAEISVASLSRDLSHSLVGLTNYFLRPVELSRENQRVNDLQSELRQLDAAIEPRLKEQSRLRAELDSIASEKLKP